jgi:hypothetical protein
VNFQIQQLINKKYPNTNRKKRIGRKEAGSPCSAERLSSGLTSMK